jgi:hypothetical protein
VVMDYVEGPTLADYIREHSYKRVFPPATDIVHLLAHPSTSHQSRPPAILLGSAVTFMPLESSSMNSVQENYLSEVTTSRIS